MGHLSRDLNSIKSNILIPRLKYCLVQRSNLDPRKIREPFGLLKENNTGKCFLIKLHGRREIVNLNRARQL